jgi:hypothetical protein
MAMAPSSPIELDLRFNFNRVLLYAIPLANSAAPFPLILEVIINEMERIDSKYYEPVATQV